MIFFRFQTYRVTERQELPSTWCCTNPINIIGPQFDMGTFHTTQPPPLDGNEVDDDTDD